MQFHHSLYNYSSHSEGSLLVIELTLFVYGYRLESVIGLTFYSPLYPGRHIDLNKRSGVIQLASPQPTRHMLNTRADFIEH